MVGETGKLWSAAVITAEEGDRRGGPGTCAKEPGRAIAEEAPVARAIKSRITEAISIAAESGPTKSAGGESEMSPPGKFTAVVAALSGWAMVEAVAPPEAPAATVTPPEATLAMAPPAFEVEDWGPAAPPRPGAPPCRTPPGARTQMGAGRRKLSGGVEQGCAGERDLRGPSIR